MQGTQSRRQESAALIEKSGAPPDNQKALVERILSARLAPFVSVSLFLGALFIWSGLDHSVPYFDAAAHSFDSAVIKQWLCHPKDWTFASFWNLLQLQPTYPPGVWFINGALKVFVGDSHWSENLILGVHLVLLSFATWMLSFKLCDDKLKANLAVIFVNSAPLILGLEHSPLIDLPHCAFYAAFMAVLVSWWQNTTWKAALATGVLLGAYCLTKQIAICYSVPLLAIMGFLLLARRNYKALAQLTSIGAIAGAFLSLWVLPNLEFLCNFTKTRRALTSTDMNPGSVMAITGDYLISIVQSFSPLLVASSVVMAVPSGLGKLGKYWPVWISALCSIPLVLWAAISNGAISPRFAVPLMVAFALLLSEGCANAIRGTGRARNIAAIITVAAVVQAMAISFQPSPPPAVPLFNRNGVLLEFGWVPLYAWLGINDNSDFANMTIPYQPAGDRWRQEWMIERIENVERGRPVMANVLVNLLHFNHGSLSAIARERKSNIQFVTWRATMSCTADTFNFNQRDLENMQWLVLKTGDEQQGLFDNNSKMTWQRISSILADGGQFIEDSRQPLPDGSELVLYRNKRWIWH